MGGWRGEQVDGRKQDWKAHISCLFKILGVLVFDQAMLDTLQESIVELCTLTLCPIVSFVFLSFACHTWLVCTLCSVAFNLRLRALGIVGSFRLCFCFCYLIKLSLLWLFANPGWPTARLCSQH